MTARKDCDCAICTERRDRPSFKDMTLDDQMRHLLGQLAVVSNGTISSYNSAGGGGDGDGDGRPRHGDDHPAYLYYQRAYGPPFHKCEPRCHHHVAQNDDDRAALIEEARSDLDALRRGKTVKTAALLDDPDDHRDLVLRNTEGWKPDDVARSRWRTPARLLRRWRVADGRDADNGTKIDDSAGDDQDPAERARELADRGLSLRQIGMIIHKDQKQVQRYLGRAA